MLKQKEKFDDGINQYRQKSIAINQSIDRSINQTRVCFFIRGLQQRFYIKLSSKFQTRKHGGNSNIYSVFRQENIVETVTVYSVFATKRITLSRCQYNMCNKPTRSDKDNSKRSVPFYRNTVYKHLKMKFIYSFL